MNIMICLSKVIYYCQLMYLRTFRICLGINELAPAHFSSASWQAALKKAIVELDLLTNIDMFLMEEKCIRGGIFHAIYQYTKANNKYVKDYEKNIESSYLMYWDVNRLSGLPILLQKLPVGGFKWVENTSQCSKDFIKNYNQDTDERYFLEVDVEYTEKLHNLHNNFPLLPEIMKNEKVEKLVANLQIKKLLCYNKH